MTGAWDRGAAMMALKQAIPYVRLYRNRVFVIKAGGALGQDAAALAAVAEQIHVLGELGLRIILVHGGGVQTTALAARLGIENELVGGRRVTSERTLEAAVMAMNGTVNTAFLSACRAAHVPAVGLSGLDADLVRAVRRPPQRREADGRTVEIDFGSVGDIVSLDASVLERLLDGGMVPVVSPLCADERGNVLNVNADTVAARIAGAIGAEKLIFLTDTPGLLGDRGDPTSLVSYTDVGQVAEMRERGAIAGGMLPKIQAAVEALERGVRRVHLVGFREADSLLLEIFTNEGAGTLIVREKEERLVAPVGSR